MDRLAADPRTANLGGTRGDLNSLRAHPDRLLDHLDYDERAVYAFQAGGWSLGVAVITDRRVLLIALMARTPPTQVTFPYRCTLGPTKLTGQDVTLTDTRGGSLRLVLAPRPLERIQDAAGYMPARAVPHQPTQPTGRTGGRTGGQSGARPGSSAGRPAPRPSSEPQATTQRPSPRPGTPVGTPGSTNPGSGGAPRGGAVPGMPGTWSWGRPVHVWRDAELLAADHMRHLWFTSVRTTDGSADGGLDVISSDGAAQAKLHTAATGSPDIQRLNSAASAFTWRLFYSTAYTPRAVAEADRLGVALFIYDRDGSLVPANDRAHEVARKAPSPGPERHPFGMLTFDGRKQRALGWAHLITTAADTPISDRPRKGARQFERRTQALRILAQAMTRLESVDNPLYKQRRRERTLAEAETMLKSAAKLLGTTLR